MWSRPLRASRAQRSRLCLFVCLFVYLFVHLFIACLLTHSLAHSFRLIRSPAAHARERMEPFILALQSRKDKFFFGFSSSKKEETRSANQPATIAKDLIAKDLIGGHGQGAQEPVVDASSDSARGGRHRIAIPGRDRVLRQRWQGGQGCRRRPLALRYQSMLLRPLVCLEPSPRPCLVCLERSRRDALQKNQNLSARSSDFISCRGSIVLRKKTNKRESGHCCPALFPQRACTTNRIAMLPNCLMFFGVL